MSKGKEITLSLSNAKALLKLFDIAIAEVERSGDDEEFLDMIKADRIHLNFRIWTVESSVKPKENADK